MVMVRDVAHEDPDLAVVDLPPVATPLTRHPHRMRAALGEAAGIEGDDTIGCAQPMHHLTDQHRDQRAMIPWRRADERLHDQALDIDQGCNFLGVFAGTRSGYESLTLASPPSYGVPYRHGYAPIITTRPLGTATTRSAGLYCRA